MLYQKVLLVVADLGCCGLSLVLFYVLKSSDPHVVEQKFTLVKLEGGGEGGGEGGSRGSCLGKG